MCKTRARASTTLSGRGGPEHCTKTSAPQHPSLPLSESLHAAIPPLRSRELSLHISIRRHPEDPNLGPCRYLLYPFPLFIRRLFSPLISYHASSQRHPIGPGDRAGV